jgi:magnesium transporter
MSKPEETQSSVSENLQQVVDLVNKCAALEAASHDQDPPKHQFIEQLALRESRAELQKTLDELHPADVAHILEALPLDQRLVVWNLVKPERDGEILLELSDAVRETLIRTMDSEELFAAAETLDTDEIADLAPDLPKDVVQDILESLDAQNRARLQSAMAYPENTVGALMDFDIVTVRDDISLEVVLRYMRRLGELPEQTDKLFVVDRDNVFKGEIPLQLLVLKDPEVMVSDCMQDAVTVFHYEDDAHTTAQAFERYNLVTAAVVDNSNKLIGRLTVDSVMDFIREKSDNAFLSQAGLREEEDLFAPLKESAKNRGLWLGINLITAFAASAVIGLFEKSIEQLVALAVLMPIVSSMGGNAGTQTMALVTRGLALEQINAANIKHLFKKELLIAYVNGFVWAAVVGLVAGWWYQNATLSFVFGIAMVIELIVAALSGVSIPLILRRLGYDPALGTTVILTTVTDIVGFCSFLGLATIFLL